MIAVTDHDTTSGIQEACDEAQRWSVDVICGIEINTEYRGREVHVLGYFIDPENSDLQRRLETVRMHRVQRMSKMVERLRAAGVEIDEEDVRRHGRGESLGRPHVAQALVAKKYAFHVADAFERWLRPECPGYVPRESLDPFEAISLITQAGGVPVLAHPLHLGSDGVIEDLIAGGLRGLEVYYPTHSPTHIAYFSDLADAHGLGKTGGSDFHGPQIKRVDVGDVDFSLAGLRAFCETVGRDVPRLARGGRL